MTFFLDRFNYTASDKLLNVNSRIFMAPVRNKAIDIANALLADGNDESKAIAIATAQAEKWADDLNIRIWKKGKRGQFNTEPLRQHRGNSDTILATR